ncbi:MAG: P-II family nitrogen regulator [Thermoleophilia bacterium]|nr:P-II family nitrogen regulator [Thermoleophilia bacterium]MDH3724511.1 P-II family nitrogen regulator [Thermoleophilia bacterium]
MKKIEAYIRHESLEAIRDQLDKIGLPSMSLSEIKGSGRQKGYTETYRGATTTVFLRPKLKLEIVVDDSDVDRTVDTILQHAHTGKPGDGKIFIVPVEDAIRVRTGERGNVVLEPHPPSE